MSGSSFGTLFTVTSAGESHGAGYVGIVDGCPPGLELSAQDLQRDLDRRKPGTSRHVTQRREEDKVEILSGVFEGRTTGTPIALLIREPGDVPSPRRQAGSPRCARRGAPSSVAGAVAPRDRKSTRLNSSHRT